MADDSLKLTNDGKKQALSIYNRLTEDIRFIKRQQWLVAYYCLILLGAILSFKKFFIDSKNFISNDEQWLLSNLLPFISVLIGFFGCYSIIVFQKSLARYRGCIKKIVQYYFEDIFSKLGILTITKRDNSFWYNCAEYVIPICAAISIAVGIVIFELVKEINLSIICFFLPIAGYLLVYSIRYIEDKIFDYEDKYKNKNLLVYNIFDYVIPFGTVGFIIFAIVV